MPIAIRDQQIEVCRDMIAWEASHEWGDAVQLARFSADIIEEYKSLMATLYDLLGVEREAGKPHHRRNPSRA